MEVRNLRDGCEVAQALLVREAAGGARRDGTEYLRVLLGDRTGSVPAMVWEDIAGARELCRPGAVVWISGRFRLHPRFGPELELAELRAATEDEHAAAELMDGPPRSAEQLEADLRELLGTIQDPHLRTLLAAIFGEDSETWQSYRVAPAAKRFHQAYPHGLLEHSLSVAQAVSAISATFPGIERDVAVTGALLHDIGKLDAYQVEEGVIAMSDDGRLHGHIPLGYYFVRRTIEELDGFPPPLAQAVLHIVLSHHGSLEHGSPVVPCTREATLVHMIDNLGAQLGSFDRLERALPAGQQWSSYDKAIGAGAFFADRSESERRAA